MSVETLLLMEELSDKIGQTSEFREFTVRHVLGRIRDNDIEEQVRRILAFVKEHVIYVRDPVGREYITSPAVMLDTIRGTGFVHGDCDDHVVLLNALAASIGIPAIPVGVELGNTGYYNHVISSVNVRGNWVDLDPCAKIRPQPVYRRRLIAQ